MFERRLNFGRMAVFFLLFFMIAAPLRTEAAWVHNSDGTYSYYNSDGVKLTNRWIGKKYYVNSRGVRQTGFLYKGKKWYFFDSKGCLQKSIWLRSKTARYYCGGDGVLYASGRYKVGKYYYGFDARGRVVTGLQNFKGQSYYFSPSTGRMITKKWVKINSVYYYFGSTGAMVKDQWVGLYYVDHNGARLCDTWKDDRYLGSNGKAVAGLKKIDGTWYYFDSKTRRKITSKTLEIEEFTYKFDSTGKGTIIGSTKVPPTEYNVETTYFTDKVVDDETLLASIILCEAGNQSYEGQQAVGMVIMNRVYSSLFPNTVREVVYAKTQFEPTRLDSTKYRYSLTNVLNNPDLVTESCKLAAKTVLKKYKNYTTGKKVTLKINNKNVSFPFLFFMTKPSYIRLKLKAPYTQIGDHVFFTVWK